MSLKSQALQRANTAIKPMGLQLIRSRSHDPAVRDFISAHKTIAGAKSAGVSVADYIDSHHAEVGTTADTVKAMLDLGRPAEGGRVCEIGPGSGRYSELVIAALAPSSYEIYEPAADWVEYLQERIPNLTVQPCDGRTLASTASESVDLVHCHKTFTYLPFAITAGYLGEMARVVRPGGTVAFDVLTENCLNDDTMIEWMHPQTMYLLTPQQWAVGYLERSGLELRGTFLAPMTGGQTELLVFTKPSAS